jgi:hypothetical protein
MTFQINSVIIVAFSLSFGNARTIAQADEATKCVLNYHIITTVPGVCLQRENGDFHCFNSIPYRPSVQKPKFGYGTTIFTFGECSARGECSNYESFVIHRELGHCDCGSCVSNRNQKRLLLQSQTCGGGTNRFITFDDYPALLTWLTSGDRKRYL